MTYKGWYAIKPNQPTNQTFIPSPRVLVICEMQSVSSRIWTRVAVFISYDDNDYTREESLCDQAIQPNNTPRKTSEPPKTRCETISCYQSKVLPGWLFKRLPTKSIFGTRSVWDSCAARTKMLGFFDISLFGRLTHQAINSTLQSKYILGEAPHSETRRFNLIIPPGANAWQAFRKSGAKQMCYQSKIFALVFKSKNFHSI